jgi:hypothetical protein
MQIGEIAAPASGNEDFLADSPGVLHHSDTPSALGGLDGAQQPRRARAEHDGIEA